MKSLRMPSIKAFFGPPDSRPKHRGTGTAKSRSHAPKHSRDAKGYDRDDYEGEHRRGGPPRPERPAIGQRRAKRGVAKAKRQTPADDR
jgi:hypothetical protein